MPRGRGGAVMIWETVFNVSFVFKERTGESDTGQYLSSGQEDAEYGGGG